jgi:hypothetical protein
MGRRSRPMDLVNMSNRRTPVLEFFGNGSIVEVESYKHQAGEAPSPKPQAPSPKQGKPQAPSTRSVRQIVARQYVLLTEAPSAKLEAPSTTNHGSV